VAPATILRRLGVPRRVVTVVEGENLTNDWTALVTYKFAVAAVVMGSFDRRDRPAVPAHRRGRRRYGTLICAVVIVVRIVWVYISTYLPAA